MHRGWRVRLSVLLPGGSHLLSCCLESPTHCIAARRIPSAVLPRGAVASELVVLPPGGWSVLTCRLLPGGCSRFTCCLAMDEAAVALPATWMPKTSYLLPRRVCEAAVALPPTFKPGSQGRLTCCLVVDAGRLSHYCDLDAVVVIPAASLWMRGGGRLTCRREDYWMPKSFYLPPRRGCEAAVALPAT